MALTMPKSWSLAVLVSCLLLGACGGGVEVDPANLKPVPPASMFVEHLAPFCGHEMPDKFTAGYYGTNPLDTTILFYIVCHKGDTVYKDQWHGSWMLADSSAQPDSVLIAQAHQAMRDLVEGKLAPPLDSLNPKAAGDQPIFGYGFEHHPSHFIYYSPADQAVHKL